MKEMDLIGFSILFFIVLGTIAMMTLIFTPIIAVRKSGKGKPPRKISFVVLGMLVFHWVFFLFSGYGLLPTNVADALFMPVWFVLCFAGLCVAMIEFKTNKRFSIPVAGLTTISLLFSFFINGISNM
ncbi:hypothetical protein [Bacillus sp. RAR_GA_16]|uniref:hypothetical protein n=1 Tax=Bacillus sp. RAR_GA_16 TaxID=2876774 RepID=UPI001CD02BC4|nr:hypothetical protein [Bacillus sp. RAR_GA_16]MCA0173058.1 hypothetical protein [Bacillus sp. RAR_GA_16]